MASVSRVLITGTSGFTGRHLVETLNSSSYEWFGLEADLLDKQAVLNEVLRVSPSLVVHLAAVSFAAEVDSRKVYAVNVIGTTNLLDALALLPTPPEKVIVASTATVYGNAEKPYIDEMALPMPINHYGCSKLSMEYMAQTYTSKFPVVITRPFNYTGRGHNEKFLIPKIVLAYKRRSKFLELGNLDIAREFNDVRDICAIYLRLLSSNDNMNVVNVCSGTAISLMEIISIMDEVAGYQMKIAVNKEFIRPNEIKSLCGDNANLRSFIPVEFKYTISDTLSWMYHS